jgi:hypothetical protein
VDDNTGTPDDNISAQDSNQSPQSNTESEQKAQSPDAAWSERYPAMIDPKMERYPAIAPNATPMELTGQLARFVRGEETSSLTPFWYVTQQIRWVMALKYRCATTADFYKCCFEARVGETNAKAIVRTRLDSHLPDIWKQVEIDQVKAEEQGKPYRYPALTTLIKEYDKRRPKTGKASADEESEEEGEDDDGGGGGGDGGGSGGNQSLKELRRDVLLLQDQVKTLTLKATQAEQLAADQSAEADRLAVLAKDRLVSYRDVRTGARR